MSDLFQIFADRVEEIEAYLALLDALEKQVQQGPPQFGETGPTITVLQQRILYSSVYLQLYNLVEATITNCLDAVSEAVIGNWLPSDLSLNLRKEWVRHMARTHIELNFEKRLQAALNLCDYLIGQLPISDFKVAKGSGGNWDDISIQDVTSRIGFSLKVDPKVKSGIKQHFRNELGPLAYIKDLRNNLAHGSLSFAECGEGVTVSDLRDLKDRTVSYLEEVVKSFRIAIDSHEYLEPEHRPENHE